jgi:hypothetical protein
VPLGVQLKEKSSCIEMSVIANAGKNVQGMPSNRLRVNDSIGGHQWKAMRLGQFNQSFDGSLLIGKMVALQFDKETITAESID